MKKGIRIPVYVVLGLVVLYFGAEWFLKVRIKSIVEREVYDMTQGAVKVEVGEVALRLIGRSVWLKDVKISSGTGEWHKNGLFLKAVEGRFEEVGARGIHLRKRDSAICLKADEINLKVSGLSADVLKQSGEGQDPLEFRLKDFNAEMKGVEVDTLSRHSGLPFACRDIQLSLSSFQYLFGGKSQALEIDSLRLEGEQGRFSVRDIRLMPWYGMYEFAEKAPGHTDWTQVEASGLQGTGFRLQKLLVDGFAEVDSISLEKASVRSFKNRKIEQTPRIKRLFYESVQEFSLPFAVRRIALNDVDVEYMELARKGLSPGKVTFSSLQGMFSDLTNRPVPGQSSFTLKAKGKLMDQGTVQAVFRLPAGRENPVFEVEGWMGPLKLTALNPVLEPLAKISITSGQMEEMTFTIRGNAQKAHIDMSFYYERLRLRIMREKDGELETSSFLTTLANGLVVKENNPDHRGLRPGDAWVKRDPYRSQFNYLWKILLGGLEKSAGL